MLRFKEVTKRFPGRKQPALDAVSFEVARGEVVGLLGHNGAGKSTAVGVLLGLVRANGGDVFVDGTSVVSDREAALEHVGAIFESPCFYGYLSGWKNLRALTGYSRYWDEREVRETVAAVGLADRIHDRVQTYSHGMRQRLALAQALLPRPQLLVLDEPTDGLDPDGVVDFRERIRRLNRSTGVTILLNSHLLAEVEQTCSRVVILKEGRVVHQGPVGMLDDRKQRYRIEVDDWRRAATLLEAESVEVSGRGVFLLPPETDVGRIVAPLAAAGVLVRELVRERESLEALYMRVSGGSQSGAGAKEERA